MKLKSLIGAFLCWISTSVYSQHSVNVYVWGGEIPKKLIHEFERQTGIDVHFSTYDSNETLYAKLKANPKALYDVIIPSSYYVERMKKQKMLTLLDKTKLPELKNLNPFFLNRDYDLNNEVSIPLIWGATGFYYNQKYIKQHPKAFRDLWDKTFKNQLLLLDDAREIFSVSLLSLGYSPNDINPKHIKEAYEHLVKLSPNIKLFASDGVQATMIDDDALIGVVWNGDAHKASLENKNIDFVFPKEGFVLWVDCLAIPKDAPHLNEAYAFINFLLKAQSGADIAKIEGHGITNNASKMLLPPSITNDKIVYPDEATLKRGYFQRDVDDETLSLYSQYWQAFKLSL